MSEQVIGLVSIEDIDKAEQMIWDIMIHLNLNFLTFDWDEDCITGTRTLGKDIRADNLPEFAAHKGQ